MTPLLEGVGIALDSLRANKVRAALTILGVAIGVMVVMVIGALISGFNKGVSDMLQQSGPKTFWVGRHFSGGVTICDGSEENCPWRRNPPLTMDDARVIEQLPVVAFVAADEGTGDAVEISYGDRKTGSATVAGRSADWVKVAGGDVFPGRSYTHLEDAAGAQVAVINRKLSDWLFGQVDPLGRQIKIAGVPFEVIGVFNPPPSLFGEDEGFQAFMPHGAFVKYIPHWRGWMNFLVGPADSVNTLDAMEAVTVALRVHRGLRPGQDNNFAVVSQEKFLESVNSTTLVLRVVMIVLSMVGLAVGGVGVVAIMMISVTERTREIGVRKALGASRRAILRQFLVEAATLTMAGGVCGMLAGGTIAFLIAAATPIRAHVPLGSVILALGAAAVTGVLFGIYPAARAARLDPVEALRYE
jgi:putative ABC transport system permease protein